MTCFFERHPALYLAPVAGKGRGLFCAQALAAGTLLECSPVLLFDGNDALRIDETRLYDYYFSLGFLSDAQANELGLLNKKIAGCIALGVMAMANHAPMPNAVIEKTLSEGTILFQLKATRAIAEDEEITISYGKPWFDVL